MGVVVCKETKEKALGIPIYYWFLFFLFPNNYLFYLLNYSCNHNKGFPIRVFLSRLVKSSRLFRLVIKGAIKNKFMALNKFANYNKYLELFL